MRKLFIIVMCVLGIISTTSCSKDVVGEEFIQPAHEQKEIHLTFRAEPSGSNADTRTQLLVNDGNSVSWTSGDVITVFPNSDRGWPFITTQTDKSVFFEGFVHTENSQYFAIYPHIEGNTFDGERVFSTTFPAEQKAVANSFADDANITVAKTTSAEMRFAFKNVCGLVKFKFDEGSDDIPFTKAVLQGKNNESLTGAMTVTYDGSTDPTASISGTGKTITLNTADENSSSGVIPPFEKGKYYYFVVPPITFSKGYKISFSDPEGVYSQVWDVTTNLSPAVDRTITRSNILDATIYNFAEVNLANVSVDGDNIYTAKDGDVLTGILDNSRRIKVPDGFTITLKDVTIKHTTTLNSAIWCLGNATINLIGNNTVSTAQGNKNGITGNSSKTLTMKGSGSLIVAGGSDGGTGINGSLKISLTGLKMYEGSRPDALSLASNQTKCTKQYVSINNEVTLPSADYTAKDGDVLTGTTSKRVTIPDGATVTLKDVAINTTTNNHAITCAGNATIILEGSNTVSTTGSGKSGISVASNKELIIKGSGSLSTSGKGAAGIAGIVSVYDGTIIASVSSGTSAGIAGKVSIFKGNVTATGLGAVGIDGEVLVSGSGILTATGGNNAAGIKGDVSISGIGQITATGGTNGAGILGNVSTYGGTLTANGTGNVGINGGVLVSGGALSINGGNGFAGVSGAVTIYDGSITTIGGDAVAANGNGGYGVTKDIAAFGGSVSAFGGAGNGTGTAGRGVGGTVSLGDGITMSHSDDNSEYTIVSGEIFESTKRYVKIQ